MAESIKEILARYSLGVYGELVEQRIREGWTVEDVLAELSEHADIGTVMLAIQSQHLANP